MAVKFARRLFYRAIYVAIGYLFTITLTTNPYHRSLTIFIIKFWYYYLSICFICIYLLSTSFNLNPYSRSVTLFYIYLSFRFFFLLFFYSRAKITLSAKLLRAILYTCPIFATLNLAPSCNLVTWFNFLLVHFWPVPTNSAY